MLKTNHDKNHSLSKLLLLSQLQKKIAHETKSTQMRLAMTTSANVRT
jgi:hypothetical protein